MYALDDYDYTLPGHLIAQTPASRRDTSRLLRLNRNSGSVSHHAFHDLADLLDPSDILVVNNTQVVPGRLHGHKETGGKAEALILNYGEPGAGLQPDGRWTYQCLLRTSKRVSPGTRIRFSGDLTAEVLAVGDNGICCLAFSSAGPFDAVLGRIGRMPLPPYIKRDPDAAAETDRQRYQTVYASQTGAIAAPTAGLHFTDALLNQIRNKGITLLSITLHVGYGTFMPVREHDIRQHRMHTEWFCIDPETARQINEAKKEGRRVVAVGTTSVRTLEYAAQTDGQVSPGSGQCDLFIWPGYAFSVVDAIITNFHLPCSTLLMLVSAFAGKDPILSAYQTAINENYRFFSYGDAMLID